MLLGGGALIGCIVLITKGANEEVKSTRSPSADSASLALHLCGDAMIECDVFVVIRETNEEVKPTHSHMQTLRTRRSFCVAAL